jgi:hypothetical protein
MPSRKRKQGKARKKAKAIAKSKQVAATLWQQEQQESLELDSRMQMMRLLRHACMHSLRPLSAICGRFLEEFIVELNAASNADPDFRTPFDAADAATYEKYAEVWADPQKIDQIVSYFLSTGANYILNGNNKAARESGACALFFEQGNVFKIPRLQARIDEESPQIFFALHHWNEARFVEMLHAKIIGMRYCDELRIKHRILISTTAATALSVLLLLRLVDSLADQFFDI